MSNKQRPHGGRRTTKGANKTKTIAAPDPTVETVTPPAVGKQILAPPSHQLKSNEKTPVTRNNNVSADFVMEDQNETVKSSEKPPENESSYKSVLPSSDKPPERSSTYKKVLLAPSPNPRVMSTFLLHKKLHDEKNTQSSTLSDKETVE